MVRAAAERDSQGNVAVPAHRPQIGRTLDTQPAPPRGLSVQRISARRNLRYRRPVLVIWGDRDARYRPIARGRRKTELIPSPVSGVSTGPPANQPGIGVIWAVVTR